MRVATITLNPCIDKTFSVERVVPDRKLAARDVRHYPGGGGVNVARVVNRFGGEVRALWSCGGSTGELLGQLLDLEDVPHEPIPIRRAVRENLIVADDSSGQQYRFGLPGALLGEAELGLWMAHVRDLSPAYWVVSGSLPPGVSLDWYAKLVGSPSSSTRVVVDTKREALKRAIEVGVYLIKPNLNELADCVGEPLEHDDAIEAAARTIIENGGAEVVLVSLGRGGALLVTGNSEPERFSSPSVPLRSKVGAGDSLVGGLVAALSRGDPLRDAVAWGVAAGSATVMTEGTELCRIEDVERLYPRVGRNRDR